MDDGSRTQYSTTLLWAVFSMRHQHRQQRRYGLPARPTDLKLLQGKVTPTAFAPVCVVAHGVWEQGETGGLSVAQPVHIPSLDLG